MDLLSYIFIGVAGVVSGVLSGISGGGVGMLMLPAVTIAIAGVVLIINSFS
jgi:uncharacterized membrane protein YfcA